MKKFLLTAIIAIASILSVNAQTTTISQEYLGLIKRLLTITKSDQLAHNLMESMKTTYKETNTDIPNEFYNELCSRLEKSITENLVTITAQAYAKHFSESELKEIINFYNTPIGTKLSSVLPEIQQELYKFGSEIGKNVAEEFLEELINYNKK